MRYLALFHLCGLQIYGVLSHLSECPQSFKGCVDTVQLLFSTVARCEFVLLFVGETLGLRVQSRLVIVVVGDTCWPLPWSAIALGENHFSPSRIFSRGICKLIASKPTLCSRF